MTSNQLDALRLNDSCVNAYSFLRLSWLAVEETPFIARTNLLHVLCPPDFPFGSQYTHYNFMDKYNFDRVKTWTFSAKKKKGSNPNPLLKRFLLFPCHVNNNHWTLVVVDTVFKQLYNLDSCAGDMTQVEVIQRYLSDVGGQFEGFSGFGRAFVSSAPKVPMQTNSMDCGLFCLMNVSFIVEFCRSRNNAPLPFEALYQCYSQDDMPRIRQQVQLELARGKYTVLN
jgi:Ulp1 family protease